MISLKQDKPPAAASFQLRMRDDFWFQSRWPEHRLLSSRNTLNNIRNFLNTSNLIKPQSSLNYAKGDIRRHLFAFDNELSANEKDGGSEAKIVLIEEAGGQWNLL